MGRKITRLETPAELPGRRRVAAYARVSGGKDEMLHSLSAQVSYYNQYIQNRREWEYAGVYADTAETGTKDSRPEFQRLLGDCRAGLIDYVITKSISRFARNTVTLLETIRELKASRIGVYFEEQNIDTLSADGELMLTIIASYAQEESRSASENKKWRIRKDFAEGKQANNIDLLGYNFKAGTFTVIPEEAEIVRMVFTDYLSGLGTNAIMKKMTRLGMPTKHGGRWHESTVRSILRNEKYIGDMCLQKGFVADHLTKRRKVNNGELPMYYVEGSHEAIVDKTIFNEVQAMMADRAKSTKPPRERVISEFSGIIRCSRCGANYRRKVSAIGTKYEKVKWVCTTYNKRGRHECGAKPIPEDILREKCAEALGLSEYDPSVFKAKTGSISIPDDGVLEFNLRDGTQTTVLWENRSRRESWTDEMKEQARVTAKRGWQNAKCQGN